MMLVPTTAVSCAKEVGKNLAIYSPKESKTQKTTDATDVLNKKKPPVFAPDISLQRSSRSQKGTVSTGIWCAK